MYTGARLSGDQSEIIDSTNAEIIHSARGKSFVATEPVAALSADVPNVHI